MLLFFLCVNAWAFSDAKQAIRIPLRSTYITLEPYKLQDISSMWVSRQINCQLIRKHERTPILEAASSIKYVSPLVLDIKLKKDLAFSDGSPVTSDDVVATFSYLRHKGTEFRNIFDWIQSIKARNGSELVITLKKHVPDLISALSAPHYAIFKRNFLEQVEKNPELWKKPIGCGGYRVQENNSESILLMPNTKGLPIIFTFEPDNQISEKEAKKYALIPTHIVGNPKKIKGFHVIQVFDPYQVYFAFNTRLAMWQSKKNRCSVFARMDPHQIMEQYGNNRKAADNLIPSGVLGYSPNDHYLLDIKKEYANTPIPKKSKFCASIITIAIPKSYHDDYLSMMRKIYPNTQLKIIDGCSKMNEIIDEQHCDGTFLTYKSNYLDGYEYMQALSTKNGMTPTGYKDPKLASLIKNSQKKLLPEQKVKEYHKIIKYIDDLCLMYPLFTIPYDIVFVKNNISAPGLGEGIINEYYLGNVYYKTFHKQFQGEHENGSI